jgi:hypothetical protein
MIRYKSSGDGHCNKCPISQIGYHCNELCGNEVDPLVRDGGKKLASALKWFTSNSKYLAPWIFQKLSWGSGWRRQIGGKRLVRWDKWSK